MKSLGIGMLVLALAAPALAQQAPEPRGPGGPGRGRDEVFRLVDAYILSNLQERLALTDEGFVKLLPLVKRLQTDRRDALRRRMESLNELRKMFNTGAATEARVGELMKAVRQREADDSQQQRANLEAIDSQLSPVQQAKFRILELEVEQRLRRLLEQARPQQQGGARRPGRNPGSDQEP